MTAQLALPGFTTPDPVAEARAEYERLYALWHAVAHLRDSEERERLQPLVRDAYIAWDRLKDGKKWWHG